MKKIKKLPLIILLAIILLFFTNIYIFAESGYTDNNYETNQINPNNRYYNNPNNRYQNENIDREASVITDPQILENLNPVITTNRNDTIVTVTRKILSILQLIGVAVGLIMLVVTGIQFIVAKDKPEIKEVAINYIFGAFCIFGATGILTVIQQLVNEFNAVV